MKDLIFHTTLILSYLFLVGFIMGWREQNFSRFVNRLFIGTGTGLMGIVLMYYSIRITETVILDMRHLFMIIAALFGGPISAMLSAVIIASGRILLFGVTEASLTVAVLFVFIGVIYSLIAKLRYNNYIKGFIMNMVTLVLVFMVINHLVSFTQAMESTIYLFAISIPVGFLTVSLWIYLYRYNEMVKTYKAQAKVDFLTSLNNVRKFDEEMNAFKKHRLPKGERLSILLIDIDFFKKVNDTYGHEAGDEVLRQLGQVLKSKARMKDIVSRNGGEEFSILLPDCDLETAEEIAERIRNAVENHIFDLPDGSGIQITVSIGVASFPDTVKVFDKLYKEADEGLYKAKRTGRNKVCVPT
ncbi:GGDEF domain-containing protein [Pseudalkalibacillus sp. Hm43]|uniref:GGDEF domain-containing protein n=1 Tax=Pseudalkalibacillus sp. Hm43 TaxID=3450742 RepID=UPI003F4421F0